MGVDVQSRATRIPSSECYAHLCANAIEWAIIRLIHVAHDSN